jgi:hypothetical protein
LNIQNKLERAVVPTPRAAKGMTPKEEIKAVSTRAVMGSAVKEISTGIESPIRVRWGWLEKGWEELFIIS